MDGACAALAVIASFFRPGERDSFADAIEQRRSRIDAKLAILSVDAQRDWDSADMV